MDMLTWAIENKAWLFSGAGVAIIAAIVRWMLRKPSHTQQQSSGVGSQNIQAQAGRDLNITIESEHKKDKTAYQTELIKQWRDGIESIDDTEWYRGMEITFGDKPWYSSLRQYMKKEVIDRLEKPRTLIVPSEGRGGFPKKQILLDEVARIEREQGVTGIY